MRHCLPRPGSPANVCGLFPWTRTSALCSIPAAPICVTSAVAKVEQLRRPCSWRSSPVTSPGRTSILLLRRSPTTRATTTARASRPGHPVRTLVVRGTRRIVTLVRLPAPVTAVDGRCRRGSHVVRRSKRWTGGIRHGGATAENPGARRRCLAPGL